MAYGLRAKNGKPYSEEQNHTIIIGLQGEFRDLVMGKARKPKTVEPAPCLQGATAKIDVLSDPVPLPQAETLAPFPQLSVCSRNATPDRKAAKTKACAARAGGLKRAARRVKEKREFRLKNDASCKICFTYDRCNGYGCWDEAVRASAKSTLFAGVREQPPVIENPQFCK